MLKVTFDSNVWEIIVTQQEIFSDLLASIRVGKITPFITRISISMESIPKKDRLSFVKDYEPDITTEEISAQQGSVGTRIGLGPNNAAHPPLHEKLSENIRLAHECGFRILPMTNLGTTRVPIPAEMEWNPTDFNSYADDLGEFSEYLMRMGCGGAEYFRYKECIRKRKPVDKTAFSKSLAEWVDGESLAAHYASKNDIFCTEDRGRNAGRGSVFYPENLKRVRDKYAITVMTVAELKTELETGRRGKLDS